MLQDLCLSFFLEWKLQCVCFRMWFTCGRGTLLRVCFIFKLLLIGNHWKIAVFIEFSDSFDSLRPGISRSCTSMGFIGWSNAEVLSVFAVLWILRGYPKNKNKKKILWTSQNILECSRMFVWKCDGWLCDACCMTCRSQSQNSTKNAYEGN